MNFSRSFVLAALIAVVWLAPAPYVAAQTTVALTTTTPASATSKEKDLCAQLLELLGVKLSDNKAIQVVERQVIDFALHELVLSAAQNGRKQLTLGKLAAADLILAVKLQDPDERGVYELDVRVVEPLSGKIRGAITTQLELISLEEAVERISRYLTAVIETPKLAAVTVSVGTFECLAQFDHVRPFEITVRDILTAQLLQAGNFQVLQRADMGPLLDELDLVLSGLTDNDALPETLPTRRGLYHLRGTIDERYDDEGLLVVVDAELVRASSGEVVERLNFESRPKKVAEKLGEQVDKIISFLRAAVDEPPPATANRKTFDESDYLFESAMRDVHRLVRRCPDDYGYNPFDIPGYDLPWHLSRPNVENDTLLADHLLRISIDRLETVLYLYPDRRDVAYALAYCYSFHRPGIFEPERADSLLRNVFFANPKSQLGINALLLLGDLYVNHEGQQRVLPEHIVPLAERVRFATENLPPGEESTRISRWLNTLYNLFKKTSDYARLAETVRWVAKLAQLPDRAEHELLASKAMSGAYSLAWEARQSPELQSEARELIERWSESDDPWLRYHGARTRGRLAQANNRLQRGNSNVDEPSKWQLEASEAIAHLDTSRARQLRAMAVITAADRLLHIGQPKTALDALLTVDPAQIEPGHQYSFGYGEYGLRIGKCYEALNEPDKALETYLHYTEESRGLVYSSDVVDRINALGGVPLNEPRDFDLRYVKNPRGGDIFCRALATDGERVYCGALYSAGSPGWGDPLPGMVVVDAATRSWSVLAGIDDHVTDVAYRDGILWVGTAGSGIWKKGSKSRWQQWSIKDGLPVDCVVKLLPNERGVFASLSEETERSKIVSGGVVQITQEGKVEVLQQGEKPPIAPHSMLVHDGNLMVVANYRVYEWKTDAQRWKLHQDEYALELFPGANNIWASQSRQEIFELGASDEHNARYRKAWYANNLERGTYWPKFLIETDNDLWFGGWPWQKFKSSGFYRLNRNTGDFFMYGPRDGFAIARNDAYSCYDGLLAAGRMWLATSSGLVELTQREVQFSATANSQ